MEELILRCYDINLCSFLPFLAWFEGVQCWKQMRILVVLISDPRIGTGGTRLFVPLWEEHSPCLLFQWGSLIWLFNRTFLIQQVPPSGSFAPNCDNSVLSGCLEWTRAFSSVFPKPKTKFLIEKGISQIWCLPVRGRDIAWGSSIWSWPRLDFCSSFTYENPHITIYIISLKRLCGSPPIETTVNQTSTLLFSTHGVDTLLAKSNLTTLHQHDPQTSKNITSNKPVQQQKAQHSQYLQQKHQRSDS
jgi:hypothetical protein